MDVWSFMAGLVVATVVVVIGAVIYTYRSFSKWWE